jgi:uncharacterized protein (DUF302 family)
LAIKVKGIFMKKIIIIGILYLFSMSALAEQDNLKSDVIKKISPYSVTETMDKFEAVIKKKGFSIFARIDHKTNAESVGMKMNDAQVLIFGNPKGGTMLMKQDISVSLDLPLRVAVYKGTDDKIYIAYHDPMAMMTAYQLKDNKVVPKITKGLDKLTAVAITKK